MNSIPANGETKITWITGPIPKTLPGLDIFSKEWFDRHASSDLVHPCIRKAVERICSSYQLGDPFDPPTIGMMILEGIREEAKSREGEGFAYEKAGITIASNGMVLITEVPTKP